MKKQKGFTLIELIVVIMVLLFVAVVLGGIGVAGHFIIKWW